MPLSDEQKVRLAQLRKDSATSMGPWAVDVRALIEMLDALTPPQGHVVDSEGRIYRMLNEDGTMTTRGERVSLIIEVVDEEEEDEGG